MHNKHLYLLALDGGGVRGLSSLLILEQLMKSLNLSCPPKPCQVFDMMAGTSTGGLIAIMLGRLHMTVPECIQAYLQLSKEVFQKVGSRINLRGKLQPRFASDALEKAIKSIIKSQGLPENAPLKECRPACKVIICATRAATARITQFCNFETDRFVTPDCSIWEAARATSAATSFFAPIKIGTECFIDGATGANNPIRELWTAADFHWNGELQSRLKVLLSIGTGLPKLHAFNDSPLDVAKTLLAIATETENTAEDFSRSNRTLTTEHRYFRFNVDQGLDNIGLQEVENLHLIEAVTKQYLEKQSVYEARTIFKEMCSQETAIFQQDQTTQCTTIQGIENMDTCFEQDRAELYRALRRTLSKTRPQEDNTYAKAAEMLAEFLRQKYTQHGRWYSSIHWYMDGELRDLNIRTYDGKTPLHIAVHCKEEAKEKVQLLLSYGADPAIQDYSGMTPVDYAWTKGDAELFILLLSEWQHRFIAGTCKDNI